MAQGNYTVRDLYQGGPSSLSPNYGDTFTGYRMPAGRLGVSQNPSTANQLAELDKSLKQGAKVSEVQALEPNTFESIPRHHFEDIRRTAKYAGGKATMHAPVQEMDPAGVSGKEQRWSEINRKQIESQLKDVADKAHLMDQSGNVPITIHASNVPGNEWEKDPKTGEEKLGTMWVIDQSSGQFMPIREEEKYGTSLNPHKDEKGNYVIGEKGPWTPQDKVRNQNITQWQDSIDQHLFNKERAEEILKQNEKPIRETIRYLRERVKSDKDIDKVLEQRPELKQVWDKYQTASLYLEDIEKKVNNLLDEGYKYAANDKQFKKFKELDKEYKRRLENVRDNAKDDIEYRSKRLNELQNLMNEMKQYPPEKIKPLQDFQEEKAKETFSNVALHSYEKYGDKAPVVSIENIFPGSFGFARGHEMDKLIQSSREEFVNKATKPKKDGGLGLSKSQAEKKAKKLIGMTFDVGHLNIQKKYGFSDEDLQKEFQEMAKNGNLKHLHLTDNFGHHDSHLSPGMGNVPFKKYYEEMKKQGYKPEQIDQIVEAAALPNQFGMMPHPYAVESMGGSIYSDGSEPYWNQSAGLQQGYMSGFGEMLPPGHFQQWGGGFGQLPAELGGSMGGGGGSRVSGRPME